MHYEAGKKSSVAYGPEALIYADHGEFLFGFFCMDLAELAGGGWSMNRASLYFP